jgi:hypothetical protein
MELPQPGSDTICHLGDFPAHLLQLLPEACQLLLHTAGHSLDVFAGPVEEPLTIFLRLVEILSHRSEVFGEGCHQGTSFFFWIGGGSVLLPPLLLPLRKPVARQVQRPTARRPGGALPSPHRRRLNDATLLI